MTGFVRTVLGDVGPSTLGSVDAHEHVFLRSPALPGKDFLDPERMIEELQFVNNSGIDTVVDLTTIGIGRQPVQLARVSRESGVHIIAATGFHRDAHYPREHWVSSASAATLTSAMIRDIAEGMDGLDWDGPAREPTTVRAGIIKIGASYHHLSPAESMRLHAAGNAALQTGVQVVAHCEIGTAAEQILNELEEAGIEPSRVALAHMDRNPDPYVHVALLDRGARLVYDTVGRIKYRPDSQLVELIAAMIEAGHGDRIMVGTDVGSRETLTVYGGGPGMDVLGRSFVPRLRRELGDADVEAILVTNPAEFLTLRATS